MAARRPTERLWVTEPRRATCLAEVVEVRGPRFRVDRALFAPRSLAYQHPQRADRGTVWIQGGSKRRLAASSYRDQDVWYRLRDTTPAVGATLQCHLDQARRELASRAHTALHLLLHVLHREGGPRLAADPEVKGGGTFRVELAARHVAPATLAAWVERANQLVARNLTVETRYIPRDAASKLVEPQAIPGAPGGIPGPPGSLRVVEVTGVGSLPCDGFHVDRTGLVGGMVLPHARPSNRGTFVLVGQATPGDR